MTDEVGGGSSGSTNEERRTGKDEGMPLGGPELMKQEEEPQHDSEREEGGVNRDGKVIRADEGVDSNSFPGFNLTDGGGGDGGQLKEDQPKGGGGDTPSNTSKPITSPVYPSSAPTSKPKFTSRNLSATLKPTSGASHREKTVTKFTESGKVGGRLVVLAHKRTGEDIVSPQTSAMEAPTVAFSSLSGGGVMTMDVLEGRAQTSESSVLNPPSGHTTGNDDSNSTGGTAVPSWGSRVETSERRSFESSKKMAWGAAVMGKKDKQSPNVGGNMEGGGATPPNHRVMHDKRDPYPYPKQAGGGQSHLSEGGFGHSQSPQYSGAADGPPSSFSDANRHHQYPYTYQVRHRSTSLERESALYPYGGGGRGRGIGGGNYNPSGRWDRSGGGPRGGGGEGYYQNENQYRTDRYGSHDEGNRDMKDRYARAGGGGDGEGSGGAWRERGPLMSNADTVMNWRSSSSRGFGGRDLGEGRGDRDQNVSMHHQQGGRFGSPPLVTHRDGGEQGRSGRDGGAVNRGADYFANTYHDQPGMKQRPPLSPSCGGSGGGDDNVPLSARPRSRSPAFGNDMHSKQQQQQAHDASPASLQTSVPSEPHSSPPTTSAADDSLGFVLGADPYASPRTVTPFNTNIHFPGDCMSLGSMAAASGHHSSSTKNQGQKGVGHLGNHHTMSAAAAMAAGMPPGTQCQHQRLRGSSVGCHSGGVGHQHMAVHRHQPMQEGGGGRSRHNCNNVSPGAWGSKSTPILSAGAHNHMGPGKEMGQAMEPSVSPIPKQLYDPNTNQMVEAPRKRTSTHDLGAPSHSRLQQPAEQQPNVVPSLANNKQQQGVSTVADVPEPPSAFMQRHPPASIMRREQHKEKERSDSNTGTGLLGSSSLPPPLGGYHSSINVEEATTAASASPLHVKYDTPGISGAMSVTAMNSSSSSTKSESVIMMQQQQQQQRDSIDHKGSEGLHVTGKKFSSVMERRGGQQSSNEGSSQHVMTRDQKQQQQVIHKPIARRTNDGGEKSKTALAVVHDKAELQQRRLKRSQERQRRPPRTSGLLFTWDDGSLKCVDDIDSILSRSKAVGSFLVNWKVISPASLHKKQQHPSSHDSQASVPVSCTASSWPPSGNNNYVTKNSEPMMTSKKKTHHPVHGRPNTTSTSTSTPPLVAKKVESNGFETGWPVEEIENETGGGDGNKRLPDVQQPPLPPQSPVLASGISSSADRGGVSSRGGSGKHGGKKGWGGGDRRKGGGVQSSTSGSGGGEPSRGLDKPSQFHKAAQSPAMPSKSGVGGSTNSKTPTTYHEVQKDKAASFIISSEVSSSRGRKPRITRRPNRGGGKAGGGQKHIPGRSNSSKRDINVVAISTPWKGGSSASPQVANGAPT